MNFRPLIAAQLLSLAAFSAFAQQANLTLLQKVNALNKGDDEKAVLSKLGTPVFKEFSGDLSVYSFCEGIAPAHYVKLAFKGDKLIALLQGTKVLDGGDCSSSFPPMNFKS